MIQSRKNGSKTNDKADRFVVRNLARVKADAGRVFALGGFPSFAGLAA